MIPPRDSRPARSANRPSGSDIALEAVGPVLTLAAAFSLIRVFAGAEWVLPVFTAAGAAHLLALLLRRLGFGALASAAACAVGLVLTVSWTRYGHTLFWGMPSGDTLSALATDLEDAWAAFGDISTPADPLSGFLVSAMAAVWLMAFLIDWTALRRRALFVSVAAPIAAVGFVGLVGDTRYRILTIGAFTAALLLFVSVHRVAARTANAAWLGGASQARSGRRALLGASAAIAAASVAAAVAAGPVLGGGEDPVFNLPESIQGASAGSKRVVVSPLVDIRDRLASQAETPMFRVRTEERAYWRLTSLNRFDGAVWTSQADYAARPGPLPSLFQSGSTVQQSVQEFSIEQLGAVWLPAAFEPRYVASETANISYEPSSSTLIAGRSLDNSNGLSYTVSSALPRFDPAKLENIPLGTPLDPEMARSGASGVSGDDTSLPSDFSPRVRRLAAAIAGGAGSGYEQSLALQEFFRSGAFEYDLSVGSGHSSDRVEDFLDARRGYCEQFAGAFAAMARSLGLPARVAVGFTVGDADPSEPNLYVVRGKHAHAWPEVYLAGAGWVAFEPTPGRGAPGAQNYTGVAENQVGGSPQPDDSAVELASESRGFPGALTDFGGLPTAAPADFGEGGNAVGDGSGGTSTRAWAALAALVAIVSGIGLFPVLRTRIRHSRRRRRYMEISGSKKPGSRAEITLLWAKTLDSLALASMAPRSHETHDEFARRASGQVPLHSPDLRRLAELAAAAAFAPSEPTEDHRQLARDHERSVRAEMGLRVGRARKLMAAYLPRKLSTRRPRPGVKDASGREARLGAWSETRR